MILILDALIAILLGHCVVFAQPKNFKYGYQGITKLGVIGSKLTIECPLTGSFYLWRYFQTSSESRVLLDQDSKNIVIDSATIDRTGIYECKSTTGFGNVLTNITVKIIDPTSEILKEICSFKKTDIPQDISGGLCFFNDVYQQKQRYRLDSSTVLDCEAVGSNLRYTWMFTDQNGVHETITKSNNVTKVIINNINPDNEGTYRCEVMNDRALKIYRSFQISISDTQSKPGIEIIGEKLQSYSLKVNDNISLVCEINKNYQSIHSIKWGKRISDPMLESRLSSNIVYWDNHNYRVLPTTGIVESLRGINKVTSTLTLTRFDENHSGTYICLAMNTYGGTVYKLFNITVSTDIFAETSGKRSQFFFLYILSPAILIFFCLCAIIYCCVKSNSAKHSNSVPMKQCNSSTPSNGNKATGSSYYYPVTTSRSNTNCPPLPLSIESQAPLGSPSTIASYNNYGNYHYAPTNQQSCCSVNGV